MQILVQSGRILSVSALLPAAAAASNCVAANGENRHQSETPTCGANGVGSVAIVRGEDSTAVCGNEGVTTGACLNLRGVTKSLAGQRYQYRAGWPLDPLAPAWPQSLGEKVSGDELSMSALQDPNRVGDQAPAECSGGNLFPIPQ